VSVGSAALSWWVDLLEASIDYVVIHDNVL